MLSCKISIDFPDDGAWKQFHNQLHHFPMEYKETSEEPEQAAMKKVNKKKLKTEDKETLVDTQQETEPQPKEEEVPPLISTDQTEDLLGLNEINPKAAELEESNALALAIIPPGDGDSV